MLSKDRIVVRKGLLERKLSKTLNRSGGDLGARAVGAFVKDALDEITGKGEA